jgi:RNA polymerase sigma-70 factor (ECF subfamily)
MRPDSCRPAGGREDRPLFQTTHWSVVQRAKDKSMAALNVLCSGYRAPLLVWLRCRGQTPQDAEDVVQGFFAHLLQQEFLASVGQEKGRFRTFLLNALQNYVRDARDRSFAAKRGGGRLPDSLDETDEEGKLLHQPAAGTSSPDAAFDKAWAQAVLARCLQRLEEEAAPSGHAELCRALEPALFKDHDAPSHRDTAARYGLSEENVRVVAHRLRKRLAGLVKEEILQTVTNERDWQDETRYLISLFEK